MKQKSKTEYHSDMLSYYVQGAYVIPIKTRMFEFMKPAIRWDAIDERADQAGFDVTAHSGVRRRIHTRNNFLPFSASITNGTS